MISENEYLSNDEKWQNTDTQSMVMIWGHTQLRVIQVVWSKSASVVWLLDVYLFLTYYREQFVENINKWNNEFEDLTLGQSETWPRLVTLSFGKVDFSFVIRER